MQMEILILQTKHSIVISIGKHRQKYLLGIYQEDYSKKKKKLKQDKKYDDMSFT